MDFNKIKAKLFYSHMKAAPTLRVIIFASIIIMGFSYILIYFAGGYLFSNGGIQNKTLLNQYNAIVSNQVAPAGIFGNLSSLNGQLINQGKNYSTPLNGSQTSIGGVVGTMAYFFKTIPSVFNILFYYIGSSLSFFGIPTAYWTVLGGLMVVALILIVVLTILGIVYS